MTKEKDEHRSEMAEILPKISTFDQLLELLALYLKPADYRKLFELRLATEANFKPQDIRLSISFGPVEGNDQHFVCIRSLYDNNEVFGEIEALYTL